MAETLFESYDAGVPADTEFAAYGATWKALTFKPKYRHSCTYIKLRMRRRNTPGTVTVSLRATAASLPTGADLVSATFDGDAISDVTWTGEWVTITWGTPVTLRQEVEYAIVFRAPDVDTPNEIRCLAASAGGYTRGQQANSTNSGSTWANTDAADMYFEDWGFELSWGLAPAGPGARGRIKEWPLGLTSQGFGKGIHGILPLQLPRRNRAY